MKAKEYVEEKIEEEPLATDKTKTVTQSEEFDKIETQSVLTKYIRKLIPSVPHMVDLNDKLVEGETIQEKIRVRHYSEIQIIIGILAAIFGFLFIFVINVFFVILFISGIYLTLTGYEIEDIAITSKRLILRRIGIWERIIKIPAEEEHLLDHVVSFTVGRAPFHIVLVFFGILGLIGSIGLSSVPFLSLLVLIPAVYLFYRGMRLGRRSVTVYFAGGHHTVLGLRKGIPESGVTTLKKAVFKIN